MEIERRGRAARVHDALAPDDRLGLDGNPVAAGELHAERRTIVIRTSRVCVAGPVRWAPLEIRSHDLEASHEAPREVGVKRCMCRLRDEQTALTIGTDVAAVGDAEIHACL
jgi:hypothetical protein